MKNPTQPEPLKALVEKYDQLAIELRDLQEAEPLLRRDVDELLAELQELDPKFLIARPKPGELDSATENKIARLQVGRGKLEVLPGVILKCETALNKIGTEISEAVASGISSMRRQLREKLEEFRAVAESDLRKTCGGDPARVRAALDAVIENCELNRWLTKLPRTPSSYGARANEQGRAFIRVHSAFIAGATLSEAFAKAR